MRICDLGFRNAKPWILLLGLMCASGGVLLYLFALSPLPGIPSFEKVKTAYEKSEGILLDRNGEVIHELRIHGQGRRLNWTPLNDISPALQSAIIRAEDRRFYQHHGVDWVSAGSAIVGMFRPGNKRGASTITMQLASMQDKNLRTGQSRRSFLQKIRQVRAARAYEKAWSKAEILEAYLNLVPFRGELQGVAAASRGLFSKEPQGLDDPESVILTALLRSPNAGITAVAARANWLAQLLHLPIQRPEIDSTTRTILERPYYVRPQTVLAPHVALQLFQEARMGGESPSRLSCTLDRNLQLFTAESLRKHVLSAESRNMHDGAALIVDNSSGEILAYVGNIGNQSSARYVDGIRGKRQAGSTLKPFVYGLAFDRRLLTPASLMEDSPLDIAVTGGLYRPRNYDRQFHGTVTARIALASSLNVPAVKTLNLIGVDAFIDTLQRLRFEDIRSADFYGPSLALGSADVTLFDMVNAYRALANGGTWSPMHLVPGNHKETRERIISAESAFLISDILSDRESRSRTFDLESPLSTRFWTAVKTGTSKDMRDNWCVGFSDRYTVGVWTGNFSGEPMWNVSGVTGAAPVWVEIMNRLHRNQLSRMPAPPEGLVKRTVEIPAISQSKLEWFIRGTETDYVQQAITNAIPKITYPTSGTIIALDPDIPPDAQRLFFEAKPEGRGLEWVLDGKTLGSISGLQSWLPQGGKHILKLVDTLGNEIDTVRFEVRGN